MDDKIDEIVQEFSSTKRVGEIRCVGLGKSSGQDFESKCGPFLWAYCTKQRLILEPLAH